MREGREVERWNDEMREGEGMRGEGMRSGISNYNARGHEIRAEGKIDGQQLLERGNGRG